MMNKDDVQIVGSAVALVGAGVMLGYAIPDSTSDSVVKVAILAVLWVGLLAPIVHRRVRSDE